MANTSLPPGWQMAQRGDKFAPVNKAGVVMPCLGAGLPDGGTRQQAIDAAHEVEAGIAETNRLADEWKIIDE